MARTGENIYKRKDGRWEGRYIRQYDRAGKAKYGYVYAKTYAEVKQRLAERRCNPPQGDAPNQTNKRYGDILTSWLQSSRTSVKESTFSKYSQMIDCHIRPALGQYPVSRISTQLVESFIQQQLSSGRLDGHGGLSSKTVTDILTILKESMRYAQDIGQPINCRAAVRSTPAVALFPVGSIYVFTKRAVAAFDRHRPARVN